MSSCSPPLRRICAAWHCAYVPCHQALRSRPRRSPQCTTDELRRAVQTRTWPRTEAIRRPPGPTTGESPAPKRVLQRNRPLPAGRTVNPDRTEVPCEIIRKDLLRLAETVDVDHSLRKGLRGFLRQIVTDATREIPVFIFPRELRAIRCWGCMWCPIRITFKGDRGH